MRAKLGPMAKQTKTKQAKEAKAAKAEPAAVAAVPPVVEVVEAPIENPGDDQGEAGDLDDNNMPTLFIGEPFALAGVDADEGEAEGKDGQFLEENPASGVPGCFASVLCGCGQPFKIDLLTADVKACPECDARYTHMLILGSETDGRIVGHTWHHILVTNGLMPANPDDDDDDDDDDGGETVAEIPEAK